MSKKSHHHSSHGESSSSINQKLSLRQLKGRKWKLFSEHAAHILKDIDDSPSTDISSVVSSSIRKSTPSVMQLNISDRNLYGLHPETDPFVAVICNHCSAVIKPQGLHNHIERRHDGQTSDSTKVYKNLHRRLSATPPKQPKCEKRRRYSMTKINEHEIIEHNTTTPAASVTDDSTLIDKVVATTAVDTVITSSAPDDETIVEPMPIENANWTESSTVAVTTDTSSPAPPTPTINEDQCKVPNEFVCHVRIESSYLADLESGGTSTFVDTEKLLPEIEIFTQDLEDYSNVVPDESSTNNQSIANNVDYDKNEPSVSSTPMIIDDVMTTDTANIKLTEEQMVVDIETVDMTEEIEDEQYNVQQITDNINTINDTTNTETMLARPKIINARKLAEWDCYGKDSMIIDNNNDWDSGCDSDLEEDLDVAGIFETNSFSNIFGDSRISPTSDCFIKSSISGSSSGGGDDGGVSGEQTSNGCGGDKENTSDSPRKWNSKTIMSSKPLQSNCFGMRKIGGGCMLSRNILSMGQLTNTSGGANDCFMFNGTNSSAGGIKRRIEKRGIRTDISLIIEKVKAHIAQKQRSTTNNTTIN